MIPETGSSKTIVIDKDFRPVGDTIRLSQIADSLFYVLLKEPVLTGRTEIHKIMTSEKYLFVHVSDRLFQYDWKGQFIKEYKEKDESVYGFDVLEDNNMLLVAYPNEIEVYNLDGDHLRVIPLERKLQWIGYFFAAIDSGHIAIALWNKGTNLSRMVIIDFDGNIHREFQNTEAFNSEKTPVTHAFRFHRTIFRDHRDIYYQPLFNDTVFKLANLKPEPVFIEKMTFKVPLQERPEYTGDIRRYRQYCMENSAYITRSMASSRYYFVEARNASLIKTFPVFMLYDKKTRQFNYHDLTIDFSNNKMHMGVYNDWDGGIALNAEFIDNGYMIGYYGVKKFIQFNNDEYKLKDCAEDTTICTYKRYITCSHEISRPSGSRILNSFLAGTNEKDGKYVLMFAKLKEQE